MKARDQQRFVFSAFDELSDHQLGIALLLISAVTYSTAGLFTKGVEAGSKFLLFR